MHIVIVCKKIDKNSNAIELFILSNNTGGHVILRICFVASYFSQRYFTKNYRYNTRNMKCLLNHAVTRLKIKVHSKLTV